MTPRATYRLQLHRGFGFRDAARIVPYLARLGVSHLYLSPILKARPGSLHGYDVVDHAAINPELGSDADFASLAATAGEHHLGILLDIVPNHMGVMSADNPWWLDVLENGPAAEHADHFDIDWDAQRPQMRGRLLVPVLGEPYGRALEAAQMQVGFAAATGSFSLHYYEHRLPLDPATYPAIFDPPEAHPPDTEDEQDFASLLGAFGSLPTTSETGETLRATRYRDKEATKRRLARLCERSPVVRERIDAALRAINGDARHAGSFGALHRLLEAQPYRLASWRVAGDEINYRRFFDVNSLAALRVERPEVFADTHHRIREWLDAGFVQGLRIDHPDGLYDPREYFERLQALRAPREPAEPLYVVVEKILASYEKLRDDWAVSGTTGYEFGALVTAWLTDGAGETPLDSAYAFYLDREPVYDDIVHASRVHMMSTSLAAEIAVLAAQLDRLAQRHRHTRDFTASSLRNALVEVIACFPVYRTYITRAGLVDEDRAVIERAINMARARSRVTDSSVYDFVARMLLLELPASGEIGRDAAIEFCAKFQQVTAPVAAKGVEDTAFYRYNRLVSGNEVGSEPRRFSASTLALHEAAADRAARWPQGLLATSTHDSKRSEDVRARIGVLSEMPQRWRAHLRRWLRLNRSRRLSLPAGDAPSRNDEYLFYQTMLGIWPAPGTTDAADAAQLERRLAEYLLKASREAKLRTSWVNPDAEYEAALARFVASCCDVTRTNAFLADMLALLEPVAYFGVFNSLSQTVLKLTTPGVPDLYQGTELPTDSLVDPDNRRPVDYARRALLLDTVLGELARATDRGAWLRGLLDSPHDGRLKLLVTARLLQLRQEQPALFAASEYQPLCVSGAQAEHLCAFGRILQEQALIVIVPRWCARLAGGALEPPLGALWGDTAIELPELRGVPRDVITGDTPPIAAGSGLRAADALTTLPFAVLLSSA